MSKNTQNFGIIVLIIFVLGFFGYEAIRLYEGKPLLSPAITTVAPTTTVDAETKKTTTTNSFKPITSASKTTSNKTTSKSPTKTKTTTKKKSDNIADIISQNKDLISAVLTKTNAYRKQANAQDLTLDDKLTTGATIRAKEMADNNYLAHRRPNGGSWDTIFTEIGVKKASKAENIATAPSIDIVMKGWYDSEGHRENMLNKKYNHIGIGIYQKNDKIYWVQLFTN